MQMLAIKLAKQQELQYWIWALHSLFVPKGRESERDRKVRFEQWLTAKIKGREQMENFLFGASHRKGKVLILDQYMKRERKRKVGA